MASCDIQTLLATNPCLYALAPEELRVVKTQLLCALYNQVNGGPAVNCDIQTLLDDGKCFWTQPPFILEMLQTQLLCNIAAKISGGGGSGGLQHGTGSPEGVVNANAGQFYWDTTNSAMYFNTATSGTTGWTLAFQF